jgi:hypothetical protein
MTQWLVLLIALKQQEESSIWPVRFFNYWLLRSCQIASCSDTCLVVVTHYCDTTARLVIYAFICTRSKLLVSCCSSYRRKCNRCHQHDHWQNQDGIHGIWSFVWSYNIFELVYPLLYHEDDIFITQNVL